MKIYEADFKPMYGVPSCLIIVANNAPEAFEIAKETVTHTEVRGVKEIPIAKPGVVKYESGNY